MQARFWVILAVLASTGLSGCAPLIVAGAGAVVADEIMEQDGSDGLF